MMTKFKIRYQIIVHYEVGGWVAIVQSRREFQDPAGMWDQVFKTEPYSTTDLARARAKSWVNELHPDWIK